MLGRFLLINRAATTAAAIPPTYLSEEEAAAASWKLLREREIIVRGFAVRHRSRSRLHLAVYFNAVRRCRGDIVSRGALLLFFFS